MSGNSTSNLISFLYAAALVLLILSAWLFGKSLNLTTGGRQADGTVLRVEQGYTGSKRYSGIEYYAIIRFETASGAIVDFRSHGNKEPLYKRGERLAVVYDPKAPHKAQVDSFGVLWAAPVFAAAAGIGFMFLGIGIWIVRSHRV